MWMNQDCETQPLNPENNPGQLHSTSLHTQRAAQSETAQD